MGEKKIEKYRIKHLLIYQAIHICHILFLQIEALRLEYFAFAHFPLFVSGVIHLKIASKELKLAATSKNLFEFQWSFN